MVINCGDKNNCHKKTKILDLDLKKMISNAGCHQLREKTTFVESGLSGSHQTLVRKSPTLTVWETTSCLVMRGKFP